MYRFKKILLVAEPDLAPSGQGRGRVAFERAVSLAEENQAQLTVVEALEELPRVATRLEMIMQPLLPQGVLEYLIAQREEKLEALLAPVRARGIAGECKVLIGTPFLEITREVLRNGHGLVLTTAEGDGGWRERLLGSTSLRLMRKCPSPIWVVDPLQGQLHAKILAAVDPDPDHPARNALNDTILELAVALAEMERCELHIVHAWHMFGEKMVREHPQVAAADFERWVQEEHLVHQQQLNALLEKHPVDKIAHQVHLVKGEAATVIPQVAHQQQVDLVVMGTVCRTGIAGFLIGNTAERVLHQLGCSVLTVKPEGFVSPVPLESYYPEPVLFAP